MANYNNPMVFDFHAHCYSDALAPRAMALIPQNSPFGPFYDGTLKGLKDSMHKNGIDMALTLHHAASPTSVKKVNDWAIECNLEPDIFAFGSIHPLFESYKAEIARLRENGIRGLKFHPYYQRFYCDERQAYRVYEEAAKQDMIMLFHCGDDLLIPGDYCSSERFARVVRDFKGAKLVGAHLGGCRMWDRAFDLFLGLDVYLDTSFAFRFLSDEMRKRLVCSHSSSKLLFGTDGPWVEPRNDLELIRGYFFGEALDRVLYKNASELFGLNFHK